MRKGKRWALVIWIAVLAGLSVLRVWLRMNSGVYLLADAMYDDIGGPLRIKQLQQDKRELFRSLELFYQVFFLGMDVEGMEEE